MRVAVLPYCIYSRLYDYYVDPQIFLLEGKHIKILMAFKSVLVFNIVLLILLWGLTAFWSLILCRILVRIYQVGSYEDDVHYE